MDSNEWRSQHKIAIYTHNLVWYLSTNVRCRFVKGVFFLRLCPIFDFRHKMLKINTNRSGKYFPIGSISHDIILWYFSNVGKRSKTPFIPFDCFLLVRYRLYKCLFISTWFPIFNWNKVNTILALAEKTHTQYSHRHKSIQHPTSNRIFFIKWNKKNLNLKINANNKSSMFLFYMQIQTNTE